MKRNQPTSRFLIAIIFISLLASCVKDSDQNLPVSEPVSVINCLLNTDEKVHKPSLTWSKIKHIENMFKKVLSAEINLYQANEFVGKFKKNGKRHVGNRTYVSIWNTIQTDGRYTELETTTDGRNHRIYCLRNRTGGNGRHHSFKYSPSISTSL